MTTSERLIKCFGIALAVFIVLCIIGFFVWLVLTFTGYYDTKEVSLNEYIIENTSSVANIDIDISAANLTIQRTDVDTIKLEKSDYTKYEIRNNTLRIENKNKLYRKNDKVILTIPKDLEFDVFTIDAGAGNVSIDSINSNKVTLKLGAGKTTVDKVVANTLKVDGGVGDFRLLDSKVTTFDVDLGVGNVDIKIEANEGYIDVGVGNLDLTLKDGLDNYTIDLEKGLGNVTYDGTKASTGIYGNGNSKIKVNGGIGNIKIGD